MKKLGFTLIELLVVIAIIAIITSIGVANLITAQKQARDAARREMIGNTQSAFEQYYSANQVYPTDQTEASSAFDNGAVPTDPKNSGDYLIDWNLSSSEYCICAKLESGNGNADQASSTQCTWNSGGDYYCIQNKQ